MAAGVQPLWHVNFKINTKQRGLNTKFHIAGGTETEVKAKANEIATRLRWIMPTDAEIFFATLSKDNHKKDSRFLKDALGAGLSPEAAETPADSVYDWPTTSLLVRMEHEDGSSVTRKLAPLVDVKIEEGALLAAVDPVIGMPGALPAATLAADTYAVKLNKLMQVLVLNTDHVVSGHAPGGDYVTFRWTSAFAIRIGQKKGGRVFV